MTLWIVVIYFWFVKTLRRPRYQLLAPMSLMNLCHLGLTGAARARGGRTMAQPVLAGGAAAGRAAAMGAGEGDRGGQVAQVGGAERSRSVERAGVSGRRQTETREGAAEEGSEHEDFRGCHKTFTECALFTLRAATRCISRCSE